MLCSPDQLMLFDKSVNLLWQGITLPAENKATHRCDEKQFYLNIPDVARFLAIPDENSIIIEKAHDDISTHVLHTWLLGTVIAYILQYHGYLVLHGSAVLINGRAVIFSGESGAGKSTLARALLQRGHPFITDDLVVIKKNHQNQYCILPGPDKLKLWKDSMLHFNHDINHAMPVNLKTDKYAVPATQRSDDTMLPIAAFYELSAQSQAKKFRCEKLAPALALQTLMHNSYRYFMLKPLGKLQNFLNDCTALSSQVTVHKLIRTTDFNQLDHIINYIELEQGLKA